MKAPLSLAAALVLCALAAPASAEVIVSTQGNIQQIDAPDTTVIGNADGVLDPGELAGEYGGSMYVWLERGLGPNSTDVHVEQADSGVVGSTADLSGTTRFAGSVSRGYYFLFDPAGGPAPTEPVSITFGTNVIGLIVTATGMDQTDGEYASTAFGTFDTRGLELDNGVNWFALSGDRHTVTLNFDGSSSVQVRILTNPEPSTLALFGLGAVGMVALQRRRRRARAAK